MSILKLKIKVCGNPDKGQDPDKAPYGVPRTTTIRAARIEIIRLCVEEFQDKHCLGGGNWEEAILYRGDEEVGRMSWNGRVWDKNGKEIVM